MKLIGISGQAGSGKDTVAAMLSRAMSGAAIVSLGDLVRDQLSSIVADSDRTLQRTVADYRRRTVSSGYWVDLAISQVGTDMETLVLAGIYAPGEARHLQQLGGVLAWVEAPEPLRLQRIENRANGKRDELLVRDKAAFMLQLEAERGRQLLADGATASLLQVKVLAQYCVLNDGDLDDLNEAVNRFVIHLKREFSHPTGNLSLVMTSEEMGYDAASPWREELESLAKLEKTHFFEAFLGGPQAVVRGEAVEVRPGMPLRDAVRVLYTPNLRSITGNQTAKRMAAIFEERDPQLAVANLRVLKPSNQEEEYFVGLNDHEFYDLHLKAHLLWLQNEDKVIEALRARLDEIQKTDRIQFEGKRDRGLDRKSWPRKFEQ